MTTRPSVALVHIAAIIGITPFAERNAAHAVFGQYTILIHNNLKYTFDIKLDDIGLLLNRVSF